MGVLEDSLKEALASADRESIYNERMQCYVFSLQVCAELMTVVLGRESVPDFAGSIAMAEYISPAIKQIAFLHPRKGLQTAYVRRGTGWFEALHVA